MACMHAHTAFHNCPQLVKSQDVVLKEEPLSYNKENLLNPCFVVFGKKLEVKEEAK